MKYVVLVLIFIFQFPQAKAETIYQWTDPWGQIQYSRTPVPGSMVSDLTELPVQQATTEQQKQEAMVKKLQQMRQDNLRHAQNEAEKQASKMKVMKDRNRCEALQNMTMEMQTAYLRQFSMPGLLWMPGYVIYPPVNLIREMRYYRCK